MKTENNKDANVSAKTKASIKTLKLAKETIETLRDQDAEAVRGGVATRTCSGVGNGSA